jgi:hypothetical protein
MELLPTISLRPQYPCTLNRRAHQREPAQGEIALNRYNRNAVLLPMASIGNTRLTSSKLDDIQFWMKRISKTAGIGTTVDSPITGSVSSSMETGAASHLLMANVTGLRPAEK